MTPRITRLTAAQVAALAEYRDRWIQIGLSTEPANRPAAEAAIAETYRRGGLAPPASIVWCQSPPAMLLSAALTMALSQTDQGGAVGGD